MGVSLATDIPVLPLGEVPAKRRHKTPRRPIGGEAEVHLQAGQRFRYWLIRRWMVSEPVVLWVLLHAGSADAQTNDSITERLIGWSYRLGFGGMLVAQLYPLCTTSEAKLRAWRAIAHGSPYQEGGWHHVTAAAEAAREMAGRLHCRTRIAAWGQLDSVGREDLDAWCDIFGAKPPNLCLGTSDTGDPLHPSVRGSRRIPDDATLVPFRYPLGLGRD